MPEAHWNPAWNSPNYEWPVTPTPDAALVARIGELVTDEGGRLNEEAHADRAVTMTFPNKSVPGTSLRKQQPRAECRRRALVTIPDKRKPFLGRRPDPLKVCVVCDAVHLWPTMA